MDEVRSRVVGNSFFESIARQLPEEYTASHIRQLAMEYALNDTEESRDFLRNHFAEKNIDYDRALETLAEDNPWEPQSRDVILYLLADALDKKIVVVQADLPLAEFPEDSKPITNDDIVIVSDHAGFHFESTVPQIPSKR